MALEPHLDGAAYQLTWKSSIVELSYSTWMGDCCLNTAANLDLISVLYSLLALCWGWECTEPVVWTTIDTTCRRCQAGLEILVDLLICNPSSVSRMKKTDFVTQNKFWQLNVCPFKLRRFFRVHERIPTIFLFPSKTVFFIRHET